MAKSVAFAADESRLASLLLSYSPSPEASEAMLASRPSARKDSSADSPQCSRSPEASEAMLASRPSARKDCSADCPEIRRAG